MFHSFLVLKPSQKFLFSALTWCLIFSAWNVQAQTVLVNDTNISSFNNKTIIGIFTANTIRSYPYEEAYGANDYWNKWDVLQNSDYTFSFRIGSDYYLTANADGSFGVARSIGAKEKFGLEEENATYYIKTWTGAYVGCTGSGWGNLEQVDRKTDNERWYFFQPSDPTSQTVVDANINSFSHHNIMGIFNGNSVRTFPYEEAYGADDSWVKWDVVDNGDGTYSFKVGNNHYLHAEQVNGATIQSTNGRYGKFTLTEQDGSFHIQTDDAWYLKCAGTGYKNIELVAGPSDATRWDFFQVGKPAINTPLPIADAGPDQSAYVYDTVTLDATASYDPNGTNPLGYIWTIDEAPVGSNASLSNIYARRPTITMDVPGRYVFRLRIVNSSRYYSYADRMIVTVEQNIKYATKSNVTDNTASVWFPAEFHQIPAVFSSMQTFNGSDASDLRIFNVDVDGFDTFVEEEQSKDSETSHGNETIGYLAINNGIIYDQNDNPIGEVGTVSVLQTNRDTWFTVNTSQNWGNAVIFANMNSYQGTQPAHVRVRHVSGISFQYKVEEWEYLDGSHATETISYIILKTGIHTLPDRTSIQVKKQNADNDFKEISFNQTFHTTPVVLSQSQTTNGDTAIVTRQKNITTVGLKVRVQEEEKENGNHSSETIGIIAVGRLVQ